MSVKQFILGKYKLKIHPNETFIGNAIFFGKAKCEKEDFKNICQLINDELNKNYKNQNGNGNRYWRIEFDDEIKKLDSLAKQYNSGLN